MLKTKKKNQNFSGLRYIQHTYLFSKEAAVLWSWWSVSNICVLAIVSLLIQGSVLQATLSIKLFKFPLNIYFSEKDTKEWGESN